MNGINTGGPAFPNEGFNGWGEPQQGMTLRDYFAAKAMQSMCLTVKREQDVEIIPEAAYKMADAMLRAREVT